MNASPCFTFTGNLLWERTLEFSAWTPGRTQRAERESFQVGGKGINVTRMLARLGTAAPALCFPGGATGSDCTRWLEQHALPHVAFATTAPTRIGIVVRGGAHAETTFLGLDAAPDADALLACAAFLDAQPDHAVLVVAGSLPGWSTPAFDPLRAAFQRWCTRGVLYVDTYGPPLPWFAQLPVALVKINRTEFDSLIPPPPGETSPAARLALAQARYAAQAWIVTSGGESIWLRSADVSAREFSPSRVQEVSATGSGDVLLACLVHARHVLALDLPHALAWALPFAAANAAHAGIAEFDLTNVIQENC